MLFHMICRVLALWTLTLPVMASNHPDILIPSPPAIAAKSYVLLDAKSGKILAEKAKDMSLPPASLTKLMSLYVLSNALSHHQIHLTDKVFVSKKAWKTGGSRLFIRAGSHVPAKTLIQGMIVASGNDATTAMAEHLAGQTDAFVDVMNQTAAMLHLKHTHFMNPTGLPHPRHKTTAYDLAQLTRHYILAFPDNYPWFKQKWIRYNHIRQPNRNRLLWQDARVDGLKTGHTDAAGYCMVTSGAVDNTRLIAVVMGTKSDHARTQTSEALLNYGFRYYQTKTIDNQAIHTHRARVWGGQSKYVTVGLAANHHYTIARGDTTPPTFDIKLSDLHAPIKQGQACGTLTIRIKQKVMAQYPLIAQQAVKTGSTWQVWTDKIGYWFNHRD